MEIQSVSSSLNAAAAYANQQQSVRQREERDDLVGDRRGGSQETGEESARVTLSTESRQLDIRPNQQVDRPQDSNRVDFNARADDNQRAARVEDQREQTPASVTRALEAYSRTEALG
jgi:hypothetical protein